MAPSDRTDARASGYRRRDRPNNNNVHRKAVRRSTTLSLLSSLFSTPTVLIAGVVALVAGLIFWLNGSHIELGRHRSRVVDWDARREKVKEAFISSWDAYSKYAWG